MQRETAYNEIKESIERVRKIMREGIGDAKDEQSNDGVPYTKQDDLYNSSVEAARAQLGADFSGSKNPMLYYPQDNDVVLSGTIPSLNNAKFQLRFRENNGCFLWVDSILLNDEAVSRLSRLVGFYKNWRQQLEMTGDLKPISLHNQEA
ncbi:MAG: hypothetical protein LUD72_07485 [Bacteroidales bacterium]|nr:hypothetical protein [Bacteroidales bacterium]